MYLPYVYHLDCLSDLSPIYLTGFCFLFYSRFTNRSRTRKPAFWMTCNVSPAQGRNTNICGLDSKSDAQFTFNILRSEWNRQYFADGILKCDLTYFKAQTKWPPFSRRHFQMNFLEWQFLNFSEKLTEFFPNSPNNNKPSLVQIMGGRRRGHKSLSEPMEALFTDAYIYICATRPQCVYEIILNAGVGSKFSGSRSNWG